MSPAKDPRKCRDLREEVDHVVGFMTTVVGLLRETLASDASERAGEYEPSRKAGGPQNGSEKAGR